ncbi:universal stress protein [Hydrogenophaga sp.]|uniref:universal stress protein n=1 Tax=Hydrogenophaga sp. TaxID=1904254 RepID=UPI002620E586|nr:universal stress protein [Hydrogenophaga sp.]MCW5654248.1 universal stress protein [Hydrogenophaga sp.]
MLKILIPVDGSEQALLAVHHALRLVGEGLRARFLVANVQASANLYELVVAHDPAVLQQVSDAAGRDLLRPAVALLSAAGQQVESVVASGDPAQLLAELLESHACDAVIMSARGGGLRAAVLGSVSQELVQRASVPVTLVKVPDGLPAP